MTYISFVALLSEPCPLLANATHARLHADVAENSLAIASSVKLLIGKPYLDGFIDLLSWYLRFRPLYSKPIGGPVLAKGFIVRTSGLK
jgi:hypothetical protein